MLTLNVVNVADGSLLLRLTVSLNPGAVHAYRHAAAIRVFKVQELSWNVVVCGSIRPFINHVAIHLRKQGDFCH